MGLFGILLGPSRHRLVPELHRDVEKVTVDEATKPAASNRDVAAYTVAFPTESIWKPQDPNLHPVLVIDEAWPQLPEEGAYITEQGTK